MSFNFDSLPNYRKRDFYQEEYRLWKEESLETLGYFPLFQTFKETHLLRNLSGNAIKLYLYLGFMSKNSTGESWTGIETMAKYFGKSKRTVSNWVNELVAANLIVRMQLEINGQAYTFLVPYGRGHFNDPNSIQKGKDL